jgi:hypothetical protein
MIIDELKQLTQHGKVCNRKIQWPTIPVWWQKKRYCSDMPNVVSAIDNLMIIDELKQLTKVVRY